MATASAASEHLAQLPEISLAANVPLSRYTRFAIGGPAACIVESPNPATFAEALRIVRDSRLPHVVIASGTNLIVADSGFDGIVLRFTAEQINVLGMRISADAGACLQAVVDLSIDRNLQGMEAMTGIPGSLGAAVYGNAGAYGNSLHERLERVRVTDGVRTFTLTNSECAFEYRGSIFKSRKDLVILSADLLFLPGDRADLKEKAVRIRTIRDEKYPPAMKCAGSIFKNCFFHALPPPVQEALPAQVVREGKVPSAWFLEQVGAKGMSRGDIKVATYHANLIYNEGNGTAADLIAIIDQLKAMVLERFGFRLEEEVQFVGFGPDRPSY